MTDSVPVIRPATPSDEPQWRELYRGYREFYQLEASEEVVDRVWSWILDPANEEGCLVAEVGSTLLGLVTWRRFNRPSSGTIGIYLDDLFTAPAARGNGVGRALLARLSELAVEQGCSVVRWITAEDNATARRLYDSAAASTHWVTYDLKPGSL